MQPNRLKAVVAGTAFCVLGLELLLARVFPFVLGDVSAFLTIPVAMAGLAGGAFLQHARADGDTEARLRTASGLFGLSVVLGLVALFALFNGPLGIVHHGAQNPRAHLVRILVMPGVLLPAYALAGSVLSLAFRAAGDSLGRLYAIDLAGSALACFVAPALLRLVGMDAALCVVSVVGLAVAAVGVGGRVRWAAAAAAVVLVTTTALGWTLHAKPDPKVLGKEYSQGGDARELTVEWNDVSRVALMEYTLQPRADGRKRRVRRRIIHDDGISNVWIHPYKPERRGKRAPDTRGEALATVFEPAPKTILVMFAGAGADMARLGEFLADVDVTGVELNPAVKRAAMWPQADRVEEFYARDDVHLVISEGRGFLDRTSDTYDLIYVACNGSQFSTRTGHSRKFLDTVEAMEAYMRHRAPGGVLAFNQQDVDQKLQVFKRLHAASGSDVPFEEAVMLTGRSRWRTIRPFDRLYYRPEGFSDAERKDLSQRLPNEDANSEYVRHALGHAEDEEVLALLGGPPDLGLFVPTDNHPYPRRVDFAGWAPKPSSAQLANRLYAMSWVKVLTLILAALATVVGTAALVGRKRGGVRLPVGPTAWFLSTGVAYMLVQIGLMGKLDLFIGNPLWAIAAVLASFLGSNALGSNWVGARREAGRAPSAAVLAGSAAVAVLACAGVLELLATHGLGLPTALKLVLALAVPGPVAFALGTLYPTGVGVVTDRGLNVLVPATFGLAAISSVLGSTFAMVWVINVGFRVLIAAAFVAYLAIAVVAAATKFGARSPS